MIAVDTVIPIIQSFKGSVYVETPGVFPDRVLECIEWVDSWCIDLVLGSETDALEAIQAIQDDNTCFARFTVSSATTVDELKLITDGLGMIGGQVPVIIQPVGAFSGLKDKASDADIIRALHWLSKSSPDVRVIQPTQRWVGSE